MTKMTIKTFLLMIALFFSFMPIKTAFAENESYVKVIYSTINVYSSPNVNESSILCTKTYGAKLKLINEQKLQGEDGFLYFNIALNEELEVDNGYVLCSQVLSTELSSPQKELDHNGTLNKESTVYLKENENFVSTGIKLSQNQKIKIIDGFDNSKEYTHIQYKDQNGDIATGYVKTSDIATSGISRGTIGAIIIIVTTVSLVLVLFGIKGKRKKRS